MLVTQFVPQNFSFFLKHIYRKPKSIMILWFLSFDLYPLFFDMIYCES